MHRYVVSDAVKTRLLERQGKLASRDTIDAARAALVVVDMQNHFVAPGFPAEVPLVARDRAEHQSPGAGDARRRRNGRVDSDDGGGRARGVEQLPPPHAHSGAPAEAPRQPR